MSSINSNSVYSALLLSFASISAGCSSEEVSTVEQQETEAYQATLEELQELGIIELDENGQIIAGDLDVLDLDIPTAPEFRWSLSAFDNNGVIQELEIFEPDPNWIANDFLSLTLLNQDQTLEAVIACSSVTWEIETLGDDLFVLNLAETGDVVPDCIDNAPPGLVQSVFADLNTIEIDSSVDGQLGVSNGGGGTVLYFYPAGLDLTNL